MRRTHEHDSLSCLIDELGVDFGIVEAKTFDSESTLTSAIWKELKKYGAESGLVTHHPKIKLQFSWNRDAITTKGFSSMAPAERGIEKTMRGLGFKQTPTNEWSNGQWLVDISPEDDRKPELTWNILVVPAEKD